MPRNIQAKRKREIDKEVKLEQQKAKMLKTLSPLEEITGDHLPTKWETGDRIIGKIQEINFESRWMKKEPDFKFHKKEMDKKICELGKIVYEAIGPLSGGKRRRKKRTRRRRKSRRRMRGKRKGKTRRKSRR